MLYKYLLQSTILFHVTLLYGYSITLDTVISCTCIIVTLDTVIHVLGSSLHRYPITLDIIVSSACITVTRTLLFYALVSLLHGHSHILNTVMSYRYLLQWTLVTPDTIITATSISLYSCPK